jgi:hypothetical protein
MLLTMSGVIMPKAQDVAVSSSISAAISEAVVSFPAPLRQRPAEPGLA